MYKNLISINFFGFPLIYEDKFIKKAKEGIVIIEINVVVKRILAATLWFFLYASAINIVDIAVGVPAWRTKAEVSFKLKFKILLTKNMIKGKINNFTKIEYPIPSPKL